MAKVTGGALAALASITLLLAAVPLAGCDRSAPAPGDLALERQPPSDKPADPLEIATAACKEETRAKGIKSIAAIFSRLRPGQADADFAACMRGRGYEVNQ